MSQSVIETNAGVTPPRNVLATVPRRKLTIPPAPPKLLRRPGVEAQIRDGARQRLLLITAPTGHGKTTTTAEALRSLPSVAWVSLDGTARSPCLLQRHILASLGHVTGLELTVSAPMTEPDDPLAVACHHLEGVAGEIVLVLDVGAAELRGASAKILEHVLDWLPSNIHIVVLARHQPPLGIELRRAHGEVAELGPDDLLFTDDEVGTYLDRTWQLALDEVTARRVADVAEGWPVALQVVASRLNDTSTDVGTTARLAVDGSELARDLVHEILEGLTEADRRFLLDIVVFEELDPDRCERLTGQSAGAERLHRLHAAGLLLPAGTSCGAYRHRRLTRRLLLADLHVRQPARETALHLVAASVLATDGAWAEAISHAIDAGDAGQALDWLEDHLDALVRIDAGRWFGSTLSRIPAPELAGRPRLFGASIDLAMLHGDRDALERTLATLEDPDTRSAARLVSLRRVRSYLSRLRGDGVEPLLVHRDRRTLDPVTAHPLGVALAAEGRHDAATAAFRCALDDARRGREPLRELVILGDLAWQRAMAGHLVDADLLVRRASALASDLGFTAPPRPARLAMAQVALDRGRTEMARDQALHLRASMSRCCDLALRADVGLFISRARWAHGDIDGAISALEEVEHELSDHTPGGGLVSRVAHARAGMSLTLDDPSGTIACLPGISGATEDLPPEGRLIAAQLHLRLGDARRAQDVIATVGDAGIGPRLTVHSLRIEASALGMLGDDLEAARIRRRADRIARAVGLFTPVVHRRIPRRSDGADDHAGGAREGDLRSATLGIPVEELTRRERDVLRMLPSATNVEIAAALCLSVNTVKTHLKSIFRKLDVVSRHAAVQEARALGLI
jgi:LuxR family transcriptional regulator, maltose regulon positive regulatory protein